jgi:hypothetical protein
MQVFGRLNLVFKRLCGLFWWMLGFFYSRVYVLDRPLNLLGVVLVEFITGLERSVLPSTISMGKP